jgi:AcrR family transcriptional regulator
MSALVTAMSHTISKRDPEGTRRRILEAATEQFSSLGLAGARVDAIASAADTNERMLYYYYQSKEGLYVAVLEAMYEDFSHREKSLVLSALEPAEAMRSLAHSIWSHLYENPRWLSLINNENLHECRYLRQSTKVQEAISPIVDMLRGILARGASAGEFRDDVDALDFYSTIVGMGYYIVSNRHTVKLFTGRDYSEASARANITDLHSDMLLAYLSRR